MSRMPDPAIYTHGHDESVLRSHRWRTAANSAAYLLPLLRPGLRLLDVGCGPATVTVDLARSVAPGLVVAVDRVEGVLSEVRGPGAGTAVAFGAADVYELPFGPGAFDVVHAHQVLQHLNDPVVALREMGRVARPDGVVAARDSDYDAMTWHPADPLLDRWLELYRSVARANGGEPDAGRYLRSWALQAGFSQVASSASAWCYAEPDERQWWGGLWADRVTRTSLGHRSVELGLASVAELDEMAAAWRRWAAAPDGWFAVLHGEIICRL